MKCFNHPDIDAVTQCRCGKGLCRNCAEKFNPPLCIDCVTSLALEEERNAKADLTQKLARVSKEKFKAYFFLIWVTCSIAFGFYLSYPEILRGENWHPLWICLGVSGLVWYFGPRPVGPTTEQHVADMKNVVLFGNAGILLSLFVRIIKLAVLFAVSLIATPVLVGFTIYRLFSLKKEKARLLSLLSNLDENQVRADALTVFESGR